MMTITLHSEPQLEAVQRAGCRKIMVLSGKRGGFGAMKPMLRMIRDADDLDLQLVLTDQHVDTRFGATAAEVARDFDIASAVPLEQQDDRPLSRAQALGRCTTRMAEALARLNPDIVVLYGDRGEVLAAALAATTLLLPIAHIQGGDVSGSLDEPMRHAVTKLAHLHFPSTEQSAERIRRMGEQDWRITIVGDNHVDPIVQGEYESAATVRGMLGLAPDEPVIVVLQHSETTAPAAAFDQMTETLEAVRATGIACVVIHPCSDTGYEGVLRAIGDLARPPQFRVHVNLDAPIFWGLLSTATALVGNSSAGLIEAPYFRLPAVNVGRRQAGRAHAENVIHADHDRIVIGKAIENAMSPKFRTLAANCRRPFGDGQSFRRIVDKLRSVPLDRQLLVKTMTY